MKGKNFNNLIQIVKEILILFAFIVICSVLVNLFGTYTLVIYKLLNLVVISYVCYKLLIMINWIFRKDEIRKLNKSLPSDEEKQILFMWMGKGGLNEEFFYDILNKPIKNNLIENLREIKKSIYTKLGSSLSDYYLIKSYIELHEKNNFVSKAGLILSSIVIGAASSLLSKLMSYKTVLNSVISLLSFGGKQNLVQTGSFILDVFTYIILFFFLYVFLFNEFTKEKRRIEVIKIVIDNIIKDKEKEEEKVN